MKNFLRFILLLCQLFLLACPDTKGQLPAFYVQHFNSENGVPNTIKGIEQDRNGFVWLATEAGLVRFDGRRFQLYDRSESGKPITRLYDVGITADGKIFTRVENRGFHYITTANTLKHISVKDLFGTEKAPLPVINIAQQLRAGYVRRHREGTVGDSANPVWGTYNTNYPGSVVLADGLYYYITSSNEVMITDTAMNRFTKVRFTGAYISWNTKQKGPATRLSIIKGNKHIFLRRADTIYRLNFSHDRSLALPTPAFYIGDVANVVDLIELRDSSTTIITTSADGIYIFKKQPFTTLRLDDRNANVFYAQAPFDSGGVMTSKGILMPGRFIPFQNNFHEYSLLKTSNNTYYLNRRDIGAFSLYQINERLEVISKMPVTSGGINCMRELKDGTVWISASGKFMGQVEGRDIKWFEKPATLPTDFPINTFIEAEQGKFWIGGRMGLAKVDLATQKTQVIPELTDAYVRSLYQDPSGILWIGTYGSGFFALHNNKVVPFPTDPEGFLKYVHAFMPDKSGRLWITTNHGLFMFSTKDLYNYAHSQKQPPAYSYFDNTAGFFTNEFNGGCSPAGIVLGNGKFSLPSLNGLVQFFPDSIRPVLPDAEIFVDKIISDTSTLALPDGLVSIPHDASRLQFHISSPYYGNAYNQNIEYSIDESDKWYRLNEDYVVELSNMGKGEHFIVLRKPAGGDGTGFITKRIAFDVQPAFYETAWFNLAAIAVLLMLLYLIYRLRLKYLISQKKRLQAEVLEKTKEQNALIDNLETVVAELEQSRDDIKKSLQFKETLAMIITHDLQSPLRFLSNAMDRMHEKVSLADAEVVSLSNELRKTSTNIHRFVEDFGIWIKKVNMNEHQAEEPVNINKLFAELEVFFSELQKTRGNKLITDALPNACVFSDYQLLKIILRNIIDNANKHTEKGVIHMRLLTENGSGTIEISDTGTGIKPEILQRLVKHTQQQSSFRYGAEADGVGFGYRFVTDFCRMLDIHIQIESAAQKGTTVTFSNLKLCKPENNIEKSTQNLTSYAN